MNRSRCCTSFPGLACPLPARACNRAREPNCHVPRSAAPTLVRRKPAGRQILVDVMGPTDLSESSRCSTFGPVGAKNPSLDVSGIMAGAVVGCLRHVWAPAGVDHSARAWCGQQGCRVARTAQGNRRSPPADQPTPSTARRPRHAGGTEPAAPSSSTRTPAPAGTTSRSSRSSARPHPWTQGRMP